MSNLICPDVSMDGLDRLLFIKSGYTFSKSILVILYWSSHVQTMLVLEVLTVTFSHLESISFPEAAILLVSDRAVQVDKATRTLGTRLI